MSPYESSPSGSKEPLYYFATVDDLRLALKRPQNGSQKLLIWIFKKFIFEPIRAVNLHFGMSKSFHWVFNSGFLTLAQKSMCDIDPDLVTCDKNCSKLATK